MRPVPPLATALAAAALAVTALLAGCGSSDDAPEREGGGAEGSAEAGDAAREAAGDAPGDGTPSAPPGAAAESCATELAGVSDLRATVLGCDVAEAVAGAWLAEEGCASPPGASRSACEVRGYRCMGMAADRGLAVSCARPGRSLAFLAARGS